MNKNSKLLSNNNENYYKFSLKKLIAVTLLNLCITLVEIIGGILSGSLALLSDAFHNFSDTISIVLSYFAIIISRKNSTPKKTFGYKRAEIIVAFINSFVLLSISFYLVYKAVYRFFNPSEIKGLLMIIIALVGLLANLISVLILEKESKKSLNIKSSYLHLLADTFSSLAVVFGGIAIYFFNIFWLDSVITILVSMYIIKKTWEIFKKSTNILMQSSAKLNYKKLKQDIENIKGVINIHHIHTWMTDEKSIYFEAHVDVKDMMVSETKRIMEKIKSILYNKYKVTHATVQFECDSCKTKTLFHGVNN